MRLTTSKLFAATAALSLAMASAASAAILTYTYTIPSPVTIGTTNTFFGTTFSSVPNAAITSVGWTGLTATAVGSTWGSDLFVGVQYSAGLVGGRPFTNNAAGTFGPATTTLTPTTPFYLPANGQFRFGVVNTFTSGTAGSTLNAGTLTVTIDDSIIFVPPTPLANSTPGTAISLGTVGGTLSASATTSSTTPTAWYSFNLATPIGASEILKWLDIYTTTAIDTEIGLFSSTGAFLATDDDDAVGDGSALSFGTGSGLQIGSSTDPLSNGRDGATLAAGTYYIAVSGFNSTFANNFSVTGTGVSTGAFTLNVVAVPEPTSLALVGFAATGLLARRRRA